MKPSTRALEAAAATWQHTGPTVEWDRRLKASVEAAFAQHPDNARAGWQSIVFIGMVMAFTIALLVVLK